MTTLPHVDAHAARARLSAGATCTCGHPRNRHAGWNGCADCSPCQSFELDPLADDVDALVRATRS